MLFRQTVDVLTRNGVEPLFAKELAAERVLAVALSGIFTATVNRRTNT